MKLLAWFIFGLALFLALPTPAGAQEDVAEMDEFIVEAPFDVRLELPDERAVKHLLELMQVRVEAERALALRVANRDPLSRILELTKYSPIPLGSSEVRVDTFFLQNALRPDPRRDDPLSLRR